MIDFFIKRILAITHFNPVVHFYNPWKRQKTKGFLTVPGDIEMERFSKLG